MKKTFRVSYTSTDVYQTVYKEQEIEVDIPESLEDEHDIYNYIYDEISDIYLSNAEVEYTEATDAIDSDLDFEEI